MATTRITTWPEKTSVAGTEAIALDDGTFKKITPQKIASGGMAVAAGLSEAQVISTHIGVPAVGNDLTNIVYTASGKIESYDRNGWHFAYTYGVDGKVSQIDYTKGILHYRQTWNWSGDALVSNPTVQV